MKRVRQAAAVGIAVAALLSMWGCKAGERLFNGRTDFHAEERRPTLKVATMDNYFTGRSYAEQLPVWQEVEKQTGIRIQWEVLPREQYGEAMRLRLAKGRDLPDVLYLPGGPLQLAKDGVILPLDELVESHGPNIAAFLREHPEVDASIRQADGRLYALSSVVTGVAYTDPYGLMIRQDWLEKLGLREPTTLDEWYEVLKAFKERDPNGNGLADEVPLYPDLGLKGLKLFGSAVGNHLFYSDGFYPDADGRIQYEWMLPQTWELVERWRQWYAEGLIAVDFLTRSNDSFLMEAASGRVGALNGFLNVRPKYVLGNRQAGYPEAQWTMTVPPGSAGRSGTYEIYGPVSSWFGISADSANPELAMRWLDFIYASEAGNRLLTFGVEGLTYTMESGEPEFTEYALGYPEGLDLTRFLRSIGAMPTLPWIRADRGPLSLQPQKLLEADPTGAALAAKVRPYLVPPLTLTLPTPEEEETEARYAAPLRSYVESALSRHITGATVITEGQFRQTILSLGLDHVLEMKQQQYERYRQATER